MNNTHEQKIAVALHYNKINAPTVSAKGIGNIADMILNIAKENNIPLHEDKDLVTLLSKLELGDEIPEILYRAIAEVISFAYMLTGKVPDNFKP
jgi:flagellar biosynthesis protein